MPFDMIVDDLVTFDFDEEDEDQLKELAKRYQVSLQAIVHRVTNIIGELA